MKAPFGVGDVVVCVRGFFNWIIIGNKYIVSKVWNHGDILPTGIPSGLAVSLVGVPNMTNKSGNAYAWGASRFRLYKPPRPEVKIKEREMAE